MHLKEFNNGKMHLFPFQLFPESSVSLSFLALYRLPQSFHNVASGLSHYLYFQNTFHWGNIRPQSPWTLTTLLLLTRGLLQSEAESHRMYLPIAEVPAVSKGVDNNLPLPFQKSPMLCHCTNSWNTSQTWSLHFAWSIFVNIEKTARKPHGLSA